ncbi:MAG: helix-hairpin-helix domain-containing protein [Chloroflexota bacterium]
MMEAKRDGLDARHVSRLALAVHAPEVDGMAKEMRIKMNTAAASPKWQASPQQEVTVPAAEGKVLIERGFATAVVPKGETAVVPASGLRNRGDEPVTAVSGIGPATAKLLATIGIETVAQLAGATVEQLAPLDGVREETAEQWLEGARAYLDG